MPVTTRELPRILVSALAAMLLSATCVIAAVGPAYAVPAAAQHAA